MTDIEIEERIQREAAQRMRMHELKIAHERLGGVRRELQIVRAIFEDEPRTLLQQLINDLETIMWNVETAIREGKR